VYDTSAAPATGQRVATRPAQTVMAGGAPRYDVDMSVVTPTDRVRWGSILAGLFAALSTLALMGILGIALGATAFNPGDTARSFGIGAGIWGALSALLAFLVGGWTAARTAAVRGRSNGLLNGSMVWVVAIPLLLYLLTSGIGSLLGAAGRTAATAAQVAAPAAGQAANDPAAQATAAAAAATAGSAIQATAQAVQQAAQDPANQEAAARAVRTGAWGTLGSLLLGLGASALGGALGARRDDDETVVRQSPGTAGTTV
jgi:hypothetical protein